MLERVDEGGVGVGVGGPCRAGQPQRFLQVGDALGGGGVERVPGGVRSSGALSDHDATTSKEVTALSL